MTLLINGLGDNHFDEALEFIETQKLYLEALKVLEDDEAKLKVCPQSRHRSRLLKLLSGALGYSQHSR